jgi:hypothetical protein
LQKNSPSLSNFLTLGMIPSPDAVYGYFIFSEILHKFNLNGRLEVNNKKRNKVNLI